jgi:hypothetical protein
MINHFSKKLIKRTKREEWHVVNESNFHVNVNDDDGKKTFQELLNFDNMKRKIICTFIGNFV